MKVYVTMEYYYGDGQVVGTFASREAALEYGEKAIRERGEDNDWDDEDIAAFIDDLREYNRCDDLFSIQEQELRG